MTGNWPVFTGKFNGDMKRKRKKVKRGRQPLHSSERRGEVTRAWRALPWGVGCQWTRHAGQAVRPARLTGIFEQ